MTQPPPEPTGQTPNKQLNRQARALLRGQWILAIGFCAAAWLMSYAFHLAMKGLPVAVETCASSNSLRPVLDVGSGLAAGLGQVCLIAPLQLSYAIFFLALVRRQNARIGMLLAGFKNFGNALGALLLMVVFMFLWSLLLIIPGIIAGLRYSQVFFLLADNPQLGPLQAIRQSKEMMRGHKYKLFCLWLRYWGWTLLCMLAWAIGREFIEPLVPTGIARPLAFLVTFGITYAFLLPYMHTGMARFYDDIRGAPAVPEPALPATI
jgi:uncharacterized membrane protein